MDDNLHRETGAKERKGERERERKRERERERGQLNVTQTYECFFLYVSQNQHILSVDKLPVAK